MTEHTQYVCMYVYIYIYIHTAKSLQSCPTLCDSIDGSPPGFPVPGILQARTLEWVAISVSNAWKWKVKVKSLSRIWLLATPWTAAHQAPPSMGFSRQEYWNVVPLPSPIYIYIHIQFNIIHTHTHSCLDKRNLCKLFSSPVLQGSCTTNLKGCHED